MMTSIPVEKGVYILILHLARTETIRVGRLGEIRFKRGYYAYVGSAFGPGGLRGRLKHHLRSAARPHWHIDYLKTGATLLGVWLGVLARKDECRWAQVFSSQPEVSVPAQGFGCSDCGCRSHLFHFTRKPGFRRYRKLLTDQTAGEPLKNVSLKAVML